jgi:exonuclease 3'-5' domain-containing protein 1
MHDCRNDSVNLYNQFGVQLENLFDTQAAHVVVEMSEGNGRTESKVKNTSLNGLCQVYAIPPNPFKDKVKVSTQMIHYEFDFHTWLHKTMNT